MKRLLLLVGCYVALSPFSVAQAPPLACETACVRAWASAAAACRGDQACLAEAREAFNACVQSCPSD